MLHIYGSRVVPIIVTGSPVLCAICGRPVHVDGEACAIEVLAAMDEARRVEPTNAVVQTLRRRAIWTRALHTCNELEAVRYVNRLRGYLEHGDCPRARWHERLTWEPEPEREEVPA